MRAFHVRFLLSDHGVEDKGVHTCDDEGVEALRARFRQDAANAWLQRKVLVNQVDFLEVEAPDDPFVAYARSLGLDVQRTWFPATPGHALPLNLVTPVPEARRLLTERFGGPVAFRQDGSLYVQFVVREVGEDCYLAIETRSDETPQLWLKHNVDASFFPYRYWVFGLACGILSG